MNNDNINSEEVRQNKVKGFMKYFHISMGILYMILGIVFYFYPFLENAQQWVTIGISLLLISYGFIRLWRATR
jgi:uncharacterized membrane protein HdeD (DUF308 family)